MSNTKSNETTVMSASDVRQHFGDVVNRVARGEGRVIVEKNGAPAVGVVSMEDVRRLRETDTPLADRQGWIADLRSRFEGMSEEEYRREAERAVREAKDDMRHERISTERTSSPLRQPSGVGK
ncbi:MAG: type II toxin-antitoxin system prevent-host-death family antitoxin [Thermomicrobiales bacterium]